MTVYAKPASRTVTSLEDVGEEIAEDALSLVWDSVTYESQPQSITNPYLEPGQTAAGVFLAYCNRIDFDYRLTRGLYEPNTGLTVFAYPIDIIAAPVLLVQQYDITAWTHVHSDLSPGTWAFYIIVVRHLDAEDPIQGWIDNIELSPTLVLGAPESGPYFQNVINGEITLASETPEWLLGHLIPEGALTLTGIVPNFGNPINEITEAELTLTERNPGSLWNVPLDMALHAHLMYECILTGDGDGVDDVTLPISSFQLRARDGEPSYLSVVIPNATEYADDVLARVNGDIVVKMGYQFEDGTNKTEEIARVNYESIQIDTGARSSSMTLTGHKTVTSTASKMITSGVQYYGIAASGKRRIRTTPNIFLSPGDICVYGEGPNDYFIVGTITTTVSTIQASTEVGEA
jgi:hypothetical protein